MMHQTAQLRFRIRKGHGVHDLGIQPSGIQVSGLQNDTPEPNYIDPEGNIIGIDKLTSPIVENGKYKYIVEEGGKKYTKLWDQNGICWHMSMTSGDEPIELQHGDKKDSYRCYNYEISDRGAVTINVPIIPMRSISNPVMVVFRLKVNGVPTSFEMMINEKDFKAGYYYGYQGEVDIEEGVTVISWQFVSWDHDVDLPITKTTQGS